MKKPKITVFAAQKRLWSTVCVGVIQKSFSQVLDFSSFENGFLLGNFWIKSQWYVLGLGEKKGRGRDRDRAH